MLVLCIIVTCFICIIYHYYTFSGTNLLTRCHSASSCFLLFLVPEKLFGQYSRNSTKQKPNLLFFRGTHGARRASQGEAHGLQTTSWGGWAHRRAGRWGGSPGPPPTLPLRLFSHPDAKTLNIYLILQKDFRSAAAIARPRFGGQKFLFWHPAGTGIDPRSHLHRLHRLHFDSMMVCE